MHQRKKLRPQSQRADRGVSSGRFQDDNFGSKPEETDEYEEDEPVSAGGRAANCYNSYTGCNTCLYDCDDDYKVPVPMNPPQRSS